MKGKVKSYSRAHGYGFLDTEDGDIFFHIQDWGLPESPKPGVRVDFKKVTNKKGFRAISIRRE